MISQRNAQIAALAAAAWQDRGLRLKPVPGTLLEALVNSAVAHRLLKDIQEPWDGSAERILETLNASCDNADQLALSAFEVNAKPFIADISQAIRSHLNFARNTVRPIVHATVENLKAACQLLPDRIEYSPRIVEVGLPDGLADVQLQEEIQKFANRTASPPGAYRICVRNFTIAEILELVAPGSRNYDADTSAWLTGQGEAWISKTWDAAFGNSLPATYKDVVLKDDGVHASLFIYLAADGLFNFAPKGVELTSQDKQMLGIIRQDAATRLAYAIEAEALQLKSARLILSFNETQVRVSKPVYRRFIEAGGSEAIVFGSTLLPVVPTYVQGIEAKAREAIERWERQNTILTQTENNKRLTRLRSALINSAIVAVNANFGIAFAHLVGEQAQGFTFNPELEQYKKAIQEITRLAQNATLAEFDNPYILAKRIICSAVFAYTNAQEILQGIDSVSEENPEYTSNECALVMNARLVGAFLAAQIEVSALTAA